MPDEIFRVTVSGLLFGNVWNNVLHFKASTGSTLSAMADMIDTNWVDNVKAFQHNQLSWLDIEVKQVSGETLPISFHKTINKIGTGGATVAADQAILSVCFKMQTGIAGRKGRGRFYMAGMRMISQNLGVITAATLTAWAPNIAAMMAAFGPTGSTAMKLGITSRAAPFSDWHQVTSISVNPFVRTMRRRQYGVGA